MSGPSPAWWRAFHRKHPLTCSYARTLAEVEDGPHSWWEPPETTADSRLAEAMRWVAALFLISFLFWAPHAWSFITKAFT
jgi:hypothetical protein